MAAALGGGGGASSPRAVPAQSGASQAPARPLPTAAFGRRMLPGSECYTYTFHSRHDSADLIHPRSPRCHWPSVTSGGGGASAAPIHNPPAAGRGAGAALGALGARRAGIARLRAAGGLRGRWSAGRPGASPTAPRRAQARISACAVPGTRGACGNAAAGEGGTGRGPVPRGPGRPGESGLLGCLPERLEKDALKEGSMEERKTS